VLRKQHSAPQQAAALHRWQLVALALMVLAFPLLGVSFRSRSILGAPGADWLVLSQIGLCAMGGLVGVRLIWGFRRRVGWVLLLLCLFNAAQVISAFAAPFPVIVLGYAGLFAGGAALVVGIAYSVDSRAELRRVEALFALGVLGVLVVNCGIAAMGFEGGAGTGEPIRFGDAPLVHPNVLGHLALFCLAVSFWKTRRSWALALWALRGALLLIIVLTHTRTPFAIAALVLFLSLALGGAWPLRPLAVVVSCVTMISAGAIILSMLGGGGFVHEWVERGNPVEIETLTGRTAIWAAAVEQIQREPVRLILGRGFAMTADILPEFAPQLQRFLVTTHNEYLEALYATGVLGAFALLALSLYSLSWVFRDLRRCRGRVGDTISRSTFVLISYLLANLLNTFLTWKISPMSMLIIFYMALLDRRRDKGLWSAEPYSVADEAMKGRRRIYVART
jgi:O-antigen ligase